LITDQHLRQEIDRLRRLERKCFASRSRFAFYDYLAAAFELYVQLRRTKQAKKATRLIAKMFGLRNQKRTHPIRVIIDATSPRTTRPRAAGPGPCSTPGANAENGESSNGSCVKMAGLLDARNNLLPSIRRQDIQAASFYRCPGTGRPYLIIDKRPVNATKAATGQPA
jgi:hypothetical protein